MSRLRNSSGWAKAVVCLALPLVLMGACDDDGKTVPERCADPPLPIYDIQNPGEQNAAGNPCVTHVGYAISGVTTSGGTSGSGSTPTADAGAGP
ncbi:MAG TPA: hypothetical protein VEQ58_13905 [Polyangiaceae bacterium]|nr:hypothetical protein [Polyangiaceae bacterium]